VGVVRESRNFRAPWAHRAVIFAIAQLSCFYGYLLPETNKYVMLYVMLLFAYTSNLLSLPYHSLASYDFITYVQGGPKKVSLRCLHVTSSNTGRFSKFFHCHILQEICNKAIIKHSTSLDLGVDLKSRLKSTCGIGVGSF